MNSNQDFVKKVVAFIDIVAKILPDDVMKRLKELQKNEDNKIAKEIYSCMFDNIDKAKKLSRPICQDTGVIQFYLKVGTKFPLIDELEPLLKEAVLIATDSVPLRHNAVETFKEKNTNNNVGLNVPYIEYDLIPNSDKLELTAYMAGGGCSLPGRATVLMPSAGYHGAVDFVTDTMVDWGINACPPLVIGVGFGTCVASSAKLAKKASLREVGSSNPDPLVAKLEKDLANALDNIGLGPQGLSGSSSVLCVNIENMARHPSSFGVGVAFGCWAHRRGTIVFDKDLNTTILTHKEYKI
ncbi:MAG: L(+)-tartrate dehydratase subunit alpha [Christensenellales bacterium]|jgi:L(+)-tartrate dehydratase alpha subunit|nr:L(+)-tartrate dehydratase subunit alpha [Clostridiales bacterium]